MSHIDFTFANPILLDYFEGRIDTPPISEFLHANSHPQELSFLQQLESATSVLASHASSLGTEDIETLQGAATSLEEIFVALSGEMERVSYANGGKILSLLRGLYKISKEILGQTKFDEALQRPLIK